MFEYLIIVLVLFFIAVLFYKQANEHIEILQLTSERISELPTLLHEKSPIVISNFHIPHLGNEMEMLKRPHILQATVLPGVQLKEFIKANKGAQLKQETAEWISKESGLDVWFNQQLFHHLLPSPFTQFFYSFKTSLWPHKKGLFKTTAYQTVIMPTQGKASVSIILLKMMPFLPVVWAGREFSSLSVNDTPLINQIQFVEIKVRKGNLLILPAHLIIDIATDPEGGEPCWFFMAEVNHPISRLAK